MQEKFDVPVQGRVGKFFDACMVPLMFIVQATVFEKPQRTHRWNNKKYHHTNLPWFDTSKAVHYDGVLCEEDWALKKRFGEYWKLFIHLPILAGPRHYIVLEPDENPYQSWQIGWLGSKRAGVSRVPIRGRVRMLLGPETAMFFGIKQGDNSIIKIRKVGEGWIGKGGPYSKILLL